MSLVMGKKNKKITHADRCRLGTLLESREGRALGRPKSILKLDSILEDARPVSADDAPESLVTMNSTVELMHERTGRVRKMTLCYPGDCDLTPDSVSVFEPLGLALLGSRIGDLVSDGSRKYRIIKIVYQPEAVGARHL